jgi:hypothetical protein
MAVSCPRCEEPVTVPAGVESETRVECPLCQEELTGADFIEQLPPVLVLLDVPEEQAPEISAPVLGEDFDPDNPFAEVREAEGGAAVVTRLRRTRMDEDHKKKSGFRQLISIVLGGLLALPIAQLILWQLDRDPALMAHHFEELNWMHWAMPKHMKDSWEKEKEKEPDTSTSGLDGGEEPQQLGNPNTETDSDSNIPGSSSTENPPRTGGFANVDPADNPIPTPTPQSDPIAGPGWISRAPVIGVKSLQPKLDDLKVINQRWDERSADLADVERGMMDERFYELLAQVAKDVTFIDTDDPKANDLVNEIASLLGTFGDDEDKLRLIAEYGDFKFRLPGQGLRGILLYGTIASIDRNIPYYETTLHVDGEDDVVEMIVISRENPTDQQLDQSRRLKVGQQVLILGAAVRNPTENILGYQGNAGQLVIGGLPIVIQQP